jgi:hypothetical protein
MASFFDIIPSSFVDDYRLQWRERSADFGKAEGGVIYFVNYEAAIDADVVNIYGHRTRCFFFGRGMPRLLGERQDYVINFAGEEVCWHMSYRKTGLSANLQYVLAGHGIQ